MKEIKKERTRTETYIEYEAMDGTIFNDRKECENYEQTIECIALARYNKLVVSKDHTSCYLFGIGCDDDHIDVVKVHSQDDIDTIIKAWMAVHRFFDNDNTSYIQEYIDMLTLEMALSDRKEISDNN